MKNLKNTVIGICVAVFLCGGYVRVEAQQNIAQEAYAILERNCLDCHGPSGSHKEALLLDRTALVNTQVVIPGNSEDSEFYKRLLGPTENGFQMPLGLPPLSDEAIQTIALWIDQGAPDWDVHIQLTLLRLMRCSIRSRLILRDLIRLTGDLRAILP